MSVLEAMPYGLPVVAPRGGSHVETAGTAAEATLLTQETWALRRAFLRESRQIQCCGLSAVASCVESSRRISTSPAKRT